MENNSILVLGNGESRQCLELSFLLPKFTTVGCNAICREFSVDHLVCCDRRMVLESLKIINANTTLYTRHDWTKMFKNFPQVKTVPKIPYQGTLRADDPFHWGSGAYAVLLACLLGDDISLVGFDLWSTTGTVNNIYKGTENYSSLDSHPVDPNYWIYHLSQIFKTYNTKKFKIYNTEEWQLPDEWKFENVEQRSILTLVSE